MIEHASTYRSKEHVLGDLSRALHFSAESLEINRKGRLSAEQIRQFGFRCVRPAFLASIFLFLPLLLWIALTSAQQQAPFMSAASIFFDELLHYSQSVEEHGRIGALLRIGSVVLSLGLGFLVASRFPFGLYFDLLDGTLYIKEGRIVAREEQTLRANGRDPIEKYFFDIKTDRYQVNLAAFRAIENGSAYIVYILPRSQTLVSLEPKVNELKVNEPNAAEPNVPREAPPDQRIA